MTTLRIAPTSPEQRVTRTTMDTILVTVEIMNKWKAPPFQRPLRVNDKVRSLAVTIRGDGGVIPGVMTIGVLQKEKYILDGQHRKEAFALSGCEDGYADVRVQHFSSMAEMGEAFVHLNSSLVQLRPDDILRGLEASSEGLTMIRRRCPFVGYDMIRRGDKAPLLSMSTLLRCWFGSAAEVPTSSGMSAAARAQALTNEDAEVCTQFLQLAEKAWGRDHEYARLWGALNLTICMWLYRRMVVTQYSPRTPKLTRDQFRQCLMTLSTSGLYLDWLVGRQLSERDRSPAYNRIKSLFAKRLEEEFGRRPSMPAPAWASH